MKTRWPLAAVHCSLFPVLLLAACSNVSMPEMDPHPVYSVRVYPPPEHGQALLSEYYVTSGDWITIYVNPDTGYTLAEKGLKYYNEDASDLTGGEIQFLNNKYQVQVGKNLRIEAKFAPVASGLFSVHVDQNEGGIVYSVPLAASPGSQVTLSLVPDTGRDLASGTLTVNGTPLPDDPPYTFTMPSQNVTVSARFEEKNAEQLLESARKYLSIKEYDIAASFYEQAYQKNPASEEAIFYSSLALLGEILLDADVKTILSSLHMQSPGTLNDWICDGYQADSRWWREYAGTYDIGTTHYEGRDVSLPLINPGSWGFVTPYSDFDISHVTPATVQTWKNHLFWGLIASYTSGFNPLFERLRRDAFGSDFERATFRASSLPANAKIALHPVLAARFGLNDIYVENDIYVGKAEIDWIFGVLRVIKGAVEYAASYDWTIDLREALITEIVRTDGLDEVLGKLFSLAGGAKQTLWQDYPTVINMLPFRNNFLHVREDKALALSKADVSGGLAMMASSLGHWYGETGNGSEQAVWTQAARDEREWLHQAVLTANEAVKSGGVFYYPNRIPDEFVADEWVYPAPGWAWPSASTPDGPFPLGTTRPAVKVYGVNIAQLYTRGAFSLDKVFVTEMGGEAPQLWQIEWYEDKQAAYAPVYTGRKTLVTAEITNRGRQDDVQGTNDAPYGKFSFMLNTAHLKSVFPRGFDTYASPVDGSPVASGETELLSDIFPHIAMWPWAPSYFGNTVTATQLYYWYHLR